MKKRGLKDYLFVGFILILPLLLVIILISGALQSLNTVFSILWRWIFDDLHWTLSGAFTVLFIFLLIFAAGCIYYSKLSQKIGLTKIIDKITKIIPIIKPHWQDENQEDSGIDLSKIKPVLVEVWPDFWTAGFITGEQKVKNHESLITVFIPNSPLPATGYTHIITALVKRSRIQELENSAAEIIQLPTSFGLNKPELILKEPIVLYKQSKT